MAKMRGYIRANGRIGLRNNVVCIATVMCANAAVEGIAREVPELTPLVHSDGCETVRIRTLYFTKTLENICRHPNNYAVLLIGLGCERDNAKEIAGRLEAEGVRIWSRIIQEDGGCGKVIEEGIAQARAYLAEAAAVNPVDVDFTRLVAGIETADHIYNEDPGSGCAGSEESMRQARCAANDAAKWIVENGGSVILPSAYIKRAAFDDGSPITTIKYADPVDAGSGYYVIDQDGDRWKGPEDGVFNMDIPESLLSMCASGAQMLMLASGVGSPLGFPAAPLVKYSAEESPLAEADVRGAYTPYVLGRLREKIESVACGEKTYEEIHNGGGDLICTYRRTNIY